jgi:hypothetical protein
LTARLHPLRILMACIWCDDVGWVCENHPERPWEGPYACDCGGAGNACPACNVADECETPRLPADLN